MAKYKIIPSSRTIVQSPISIGHKAEKGVEAIEFDVTAWVETYGSGTLTVIMRRWGDAIPYPIALEIDENNKATWVLSDTDTARAGMAYAQLSYIVGDEVVKKSDIYTFRVMDSLTGEGEPPEAYESWLEHLTHLAAEAMAEVLDIEGIVTDKTLTVDGGIADAKATGEALAEKVDAADYSELSDRVGRNTIALAEKADRSTTYTKAQVNQMIEDVEVETDTTLEVAGAAADAAETGRQIGLIKADLFYKITPSASDWEQGAIAITVGTDQTSTARLRTKGYIDPAIRIINIASGHKLGVFAYNTNGTYAGMWTGSGMTLATNVVTWLTGSKDITALLATYNLRIVYIFSDDSTITTSELSTLSYSFVTDPTLTKHGIPADAFVTSAEIRKLPDFLSLQDSVTSVLYNGIQSLTGSGNIAVDRSGLSDGDEIYAYIKSSDFSSVVDNDTKRCYLRQMNSQGVNIATCLFERVYGNQYVAKIKYSSSSSTLSIIYSLGNSTINLSICTIAVGGYYIPPVTDKNFYVSTDGNDDNLGTKTSPFKTITHAISHGGKTIYVKAGTYAEMVTLSNLDGVSILPYGLPEFSTSVPDTPMIVLDGGEELEITHGLVLSNCSNIRIENVHCKNTSGTPIQIDDCSGLVMKYCKASDSLNAGFSIGDTNAVFESCEAYNLGDENTQFCDGFGIHGYGDTTFINCSGHDNQDDGISHHYGATGTIIGGEWYNNGKGGVASPTYGAIVNVSNVYCHDNAYGIYAVNVTGRRTSKCLLSNCVLKNNSNVDIGIDGPVEVTAFNVIYDTKTVASASTFTEIV